MRRLLAGLAVLVGTVTMGLVTVPPTVAGASSPTTTIYDSTDPSASTLPSLAYEATQATEIGNQVQFAAGTSRTLTGVTITMDSWGCGTSGTSNAGNCVTTPGATFAQPITLNLYRANPDNSVGSLITSVTQTVNLKYRPSADNVNCTGSDAGKWFDGTACYNGIATDATISLDHVTVPDKVIYGIEIRTSNYGDPAIGGPLGSANACNTASNGCAYDSLNVALSNDPANVTVGSDVVTNGIYWNTGTASNYCDGGTAGTGTFRLDAGCWGESSPYTSAPYYVPAVQFSAEPTCTTTCYVSTTGNDANSGSAASPFATIQHGVTTVSSGGTVDVAAGTYDENVHITKPLTLAGANAGAPATGARGSESVISTSTAGSSQDLTVQVSSPNVTVDGFTIQQTAPTTCTYCAAFGVQVDPNATGATIADNVISGMSTTQTAPTKGGNPIGVDVSGNGNGTPDNVTVARNLIENITANGTQHQSAIGIEIGDSTVSTVGTGLHIVSNRITGVTSAAWGGYGIILNRPTTGSQIVGNSIDTIHGGGWTHAIGLEGNTASATITNNAISGISAGSSDSVDIYTDATNNVGVTTDTVADNSLAGGTSGGIGSVSTGTLTATDNYWGCPTGPNTTGCSATGGSGPMQLIPWISSFTPDPAHAGQPGFWPTSIVAGSNTATITSASSLQTAAGKNFHFTMTTAGNPAATVSVTGLPSWATFTPGKHAKAGTAVLKGRAPVVGGDVTFTLHATNGGGPDTTQTFTVHVLAIDSAPSASFSKSGPPTQSFTVTTTGAGAGITLAATPSSALSGLTFHDNGDGTATLSGTPAAKDRTHVLKITATSGASVTVQKLAVGISA